MLNILLHPRFALHEQRKDREPSADSQERFEQGSSDFFSDNSCKCC